MKLYRVGGCGVAPFLATIGVFVVAGLISNAQTNSWINPGSGNWEDASAWSLGGLPGAGQSILIANSGWKAVAIGPNTANNFPQTLAVDSITISSPTNSFNSLLLNFIGVSSPLVANSVTLNENSAITLHSSVLQVNSNLSLGGTFNQNDFSGVTASRLQIGDVGPAAYIMSNGTLTVTNLEVLGGWGHTAIFDQEGGYHFATPLWINPGGGEYDLHGGQLGGNVLMKGGILNQFGGDLALSDFSVDGFYNLLGGTFEAPSGLTLLQGSITQSGGTNSSGSLLLGAADGLGPLNMGQGVYTLSNGVMNVTGTATVNYLGNFDQEGGTFTIGGELLMSSYHIPPAPGFLVAGNFGLNGGMFLTGSIRCSGNMVQRGGTNQVAGDLDVQYPPGSYSLTGGLLSTSNTEDTAGDFYQSGGVHSVQNLLQVNNGLELPVNYHMIDGQLIAPYIEVDQASFIHTGGTVSNSAVLILEAGNWSEQTTGAQLGRLRLGTGRYALGSSLNLATDPCTIHFLGSSGQVWSNNATLQINNWAGSEYGGGQSQIFFGNNSAGLSAAQLAQIQFHFSAGDYPVKILSSGEIVPNIIGPPFTPTNLRATALSSNRIDVSWTDNAVNETGYSIERTVRGSLFAPIATLAANATTYSDTGLSAGTQYFYRVRALHTNDDSYYSNEASATTKLSTPPPVAGMIAWWRAEGSSEDTVGTHDGDIPWGTYFPSGKVGLAFSFPEIGYGVRVPDSSDFVLTNAFSLEGWIFPRQATSGVVCIRGEGWPSVHSWYIHVGDQPGYLSFRIESDVNDSVEINAPVQTHQWQHFAATFDITNGLKLYINGLLAAQTNTTARPVGILDPDRDPALGIGNSGTSSENIPFDGLIDELALYSRALTPDEIRRIYNAGGGGKFALPQRLALNRQSGGAMQLNFAGFAGRTYEFDVSTDLMHWTSWKTQFNSGGTLSVVDDTATNYPIRFYRPVLLP